MAKTRRAPTQGSQKDERKGGAKQRSEKASEPALARPAFAARYPADPKLDQLLEAFAAGNYAFVRTEAAELADRTDEEDVRLAARDLGRRIEPPTTGKFLWGLAMALLGFLFAYYLSHAH